MASAAVPGAGARLLVVVAFGSNKGALVLPAVPAALEPGAACDPLFIAGSDAPVASDATGGGICERSFSNPAVEFAFPSPGVELVAAAPCDCAFAATVDVPRDFRALELCQ